MRRLYLCHPFCNFLFLQFSLLMNRCRAMTKQSTHAATPFYVLRSGKQSIYPTINVDDPNSNCVCIYGFSDKPIYDKFIQSTDKLLTPYPLVDGYLENRIADEAAATGDQPSLQLVILDASNFSQQTISAATMAAILLARQEKSSQTPVEFELTFNSETSSYTIQANSGERSSVETPSIVKS